MAKEDARARALLYQRPGWVAAHARLLGLLPNAADRIPSPSAMDPDPILGAADAAGIPYDSVLVRNPWRGNPAGAGTRPWESYGRLELFDLVFAERPPTPGPLWFIPSECFGEREPYRVEGERLRDLVAAEGIWLHQDTLFIWAESPRVSVIHHEGAFFHIFLPDVRGEKAPG